MDDSMILKFPMHDPPSEQAEKTDVTSKAVVKYTKSDFPSTFKQLKEDTDLNSAPDNWLRSSLVGKFLEGSVQKRSVLDLSSFSMTRNYLDYVGKIDVISDAENIRTLLKTPYSDGSLSMAVHRVRNTLLINEMDIPKIIATASEQNPELDPKLEWLKNLYCDVINIPRDIHFSKQAGTQEQVRSQSILSKFLHYSIEGSESPELPRKEMSVDYEVNSGNEQMAENIDSIAQQSNIYQSDIGTEKTKFEQKPSFQRNMLWTFEDITMLVGSNMPIFGGGRFPAVSLRLRDAKQPVNILTGLDYWLDNLMCNVPELVMCYHLEGIVQKYEVIKTEDLPKLDECRFSPKVVKDIAQDILSFLKSKCTKEGHTYWLFKGNKSDIVKLYDLTSICNEASGESRNPYTIPVTSLLYRIARNMIANGIRSKKEAVSAISLLQKCILLLERGEHAELMMAANYLLAFLYMRDDFASEQSADESADESPDESQDESQDDIPDGTKDEDNFRKRDEAVSFKIKPWLDSNKEEKCRSTIKFVIEALQCYGTAYARSASQQKSLTYKPSEDTTETGYTESSIEANSSLSLYPVTAVKEDKNLSVLQSYERDLSNTVGSISPSITSSDWMKQLKVFGMNAYISLAELSINKGKYGRALRCLRIARVCIECLGDERTDELKLSLVKLSMMCGDISLIFAHKRQVSYEDFISYSDDDQEFLKLCSGEAANNVKAVNDIDSMFQLDNEQLLVKTVAWYEQSLDCSPSTDEKENVLQVVTVTARLGNVRNELGVFYMNAATAAAKGYGETTNEEQQLWKKSFAYFEKGIQAFEVIDDRPNVALIHSNAARLMRLCAQSYGNSTRATLEADRGSFTQQEKLYFNKAFEFYQKAFSSLRCRQTMQEVWDRISFELSGAYFAMACLMQDYAPLYCTSEEEVVKDVQSLMMKSLHYCEDEAKNKASPRYQSIRKRIGKIHHRIASLYQHSYRNKNQESGTKKFKSLAELHYNKAYQYLDDQSLVVEYLSTLTEHVALHMLNITSNTSVLNQIKKLKAALLLCIRKQNVTALRDIIKSLKKDVKSNETEPIVEIRTTGVQQTDTIRNLGDFSPEETYKFLEVLERQLSNIFRELITCFSSKTAKGKTIEKLRLIEVKKMYEVFLRSSASKDSDTDIVSKIDRKSSLLIGVIERIGVNAVLN